MRFRAGAAVFKQAIVLDSVEDRERLSASDRVRVVAFKYSHWEAFEKREIRKGSIGVEVRPVSISSAITSPTPGPS